MEKHIQKIVLIALSIGVLSCNSNKKRGESTSKKVHIKNTLAIARKAVTISIPVVKFEKIIGEYTLEDVLVKDESEVFQVTQLVDIDQDGVFDELLFQTHINAAEEKTYHLVCLKDGKAQQPKSERTTYSKFVPERFDDYAWENDKIAFRTYGPKLQEMAENSISGGGVLSGIDLWLKRVSYPIINNWYAKNVENDGYYHTDRGEGYDPYHVGKSRGAGGIGVLENDSLLLVSKNFTTYKTIATGPIRTIFELEYAPWSAYNIKETKRISLDLGAHFSKFEISLKASTPVPNYTIGLTLHNSDGAIDIQKEKGTIRHWEKIDDSYIGEAIVIAPTTIEKIMPFYSKKPDESHLFMVTKPQEILTYYVGFEWLKANRIQTVADWDAIIAQKAEEVATPLQITIE